MVDTVLRIPSMIWANLTEQLNRRTEGWHESGAFLLGPPPGASRAVSRVIYYEELEATAYDSGVVVLHADAFTKLWGSCASLGLEVVADVHVHERSARQSFADRDNPMIAQKGHLALILPNFAAPPIRSETIGMHEYLGNHRWRDLGGSSIRRHLLLTDS